MCHECVDLVGAPSTVAKSFAAIVLFGPLPTQELATSPWPLIRRALSRVSSFVVGPRHRRGMDFEFCFSALKILSHQEELVTHRIIPWQFCCQP
jgi:hypothetical protein